MDEFTAIEKTIRQQQNRYYGKYRAFVKDNKDPKGLGRCKLSIPSVLGETLSDWALPCVPYGGAKDLGMIAVPPLDAQVVAEFLEGDSSSPMWTGTFWRDSAEMPTEFSPDDENKPTSKVLKTEGGHVLVFEDKEEKEKITLKSKAGAMLEMDHTGALALTDKNGAKITLDVENNKLLVEDANGNSMEFSSSGISCSDAAGNEITTSSGGINIKAPATITIEGASVALGGAGGEPLIKGSTFLASFNAHTHNCTAPGAPSGPPIPPLTPAVLTTKTTAL